MRETSCLHNCSRPVQLTGKKRGTQGKVAKSLTLRIGTPASQIPKSRLETLLIWLPDLMEVREMKGESRRKRRRKRPRCPENHCALGRVKEAGGQTRTGKILAPQSSDSAH